VPFVFFQLKPVWALHYLGATRRKTSFHQPEHRFEFFLAQLNFSIFGAGKYEEANFKYTA